MTQRPVVGTPGIPQSMASAVVRGVNITLNVQPFRLDILLGRPSNTAWAPGDGYAPSIEKLLESALHYAQKALDNYQCQRLALVVDALQVSDSWEDAQFKFRVALPFVPECREVRELSFQLNVMRKFDGAASYRMNRLCQWQTVAFQLLAMPSIGVSPQFVNQRHALVLQLDLSSEVTTNVLETAMAKDMLTQLGAEQAALLDRGYGRLGS
jgi:hypothetical protein